jgi:hypothetical protein
MLTALEERYKQELLTKEMQLHDQQKTIETLQREVQSRAVLDPNSVPMDQFCTI